MARGREGMSTIEKERRDAAIVGFSCIALVALAVIMFGLTLADLLGVFALAGAMA